MGADSLRFLAGEDVESPVQRPAPGETPRQTAARRLANEFGSRVRELQELYGRWEPVAAALMEIRAANLEAKLDAGTAAAFVQVRNSQWNTMEARDMLGVVVPIFGIRQEDIRNATYQKEGDTLSFSVALAARGVPKRGATEAPPRAGLHVNFTLMGPGSVVGHWPPS